MKKLILALMLAATFGYAGVVHENEADVNANDVTGNYDSHQQWVWMGQNSQDVTLNITFDSVTNDLSTWIMGWKASRMTRTGQVDYIVIDNSDITAGADGVVTFSVTNTAIPPDAVYKTELYGWQGAATNLTRTMSQGIIDVRQSLYENDAQFPLPTNATVNWAQVGQYLNTGDNGPYRVGTGLSSVTNADGSLTLSSTAGGGNVVGPASAVDERIAVYDGTTGKIIKDGGTIISDLATDAEVATTYLAKTGDGSGVTALNGSEVTSGTVADARIASTITRDSELAAFNYAEKFENNNFTGTNTFINTVIVQANSFVEDVALYFLNDGGLTNVTISAAGIAASVPIAGSTLTSTGDSFIGDTFFFDESTGKMHFGPDNTYPSIEPMGQTNFLFTAGTNSAYIGW